VPFLVVTLPLVIAMFTAFFSCNLAITGIVAEANICMSTDNIWKGANHVGAQIRRR
jgi:hypothetical protein